MSCPKDLAKHIKALVVVLVLLAVGLGLDCRSTLPGPGASKSVTLKRSLNIKVKGRQRSYLVHIPGNYKADEAYPLVVVLHGAFGTAAEMEKRTGFSRLADREKFMVVYPNGAYGILGFLQHWNAGFCCGKAAEDKLDDVGFLQAVIREVGAAYHLDSHRVYMTGFSNGGMLTYLFAEMHPEALAAAAPLGAAIGGRASDKEPVWVVPEPNEPVPLLIMHGLADQNVPFRGGISPVYGGTREFFSVAQAADFWVRVNHCGPEPTVDSLNGGAVERKTWQGPPEESAPVVLYTLQGWEHRWPGAYFTAKLPPNHPLYRFDAAEIIWDFFRQYSR
jgi:polyhydroxybutyrate depolymerase